MKFSQSKTFRVASRSHAHCRAFLKCRFVNKKNLSLVFENHLIQAWKKSSFADALVTYRIWRTIIEIYRVMKTSFQSEHKILSCTWKIQRQWKVDNYHKFFFNSFFLRGSSWINRYYDKMFAKKRCLNFWIFESVGL